MLNDVWLRYCKTLNHSGKWIIPIMNDTAAVINSFNLKENLSFSIIFDDIATLIAANMKKTIAAIKNNLILEKREIKKICSKPTASNHK